MSEGEKKAAQPPTTPGRLTLDSDYHRGLHEKRQAESKRATEEEDEPTGAPEPRAMFPSAPVEHPDLDEPEMRPPPFLTRLEAMGDIYVRTHNLISRKTKELLKGPDLDDLLNSLQQLHLDPKLVAREEARLKRNVLDALGPELGPMLSGLTDPRLKEPWRLFLLGWDIWRPQGQDSGVELFWEGEAENDAGLVLELLQSLTFDRGELILEASVGTEKDRVMFDGQAFYRLRHERERKS